MNIQDMGKPFKPGDVSENDIREELILMESNPELDTRVSLVRGEDSSFHMMTFQERHIAYLRGHPRVNPAYYLANLKTMIKIRKEK